ncbi:hypothetical protein CEUSTIGMA_g11769.t1 [Chlamydomonas eustigma]|uniref:DC-UbP/UBTD2 N-terminal domain-containing protein n=1 Tax=Chlamydomonas eustigma TaxID=1157962 RepID=A0A250XMP9_9CHLO|nr:hypothetical protein CEUSTIGMA_g11769.t1 [Chlamydomonas eustigma]|eukprot:GAX84347.1 hypothetical protein CEUSTIGMA_g11769.t1 [Chlamydomonas eustigma]
MGCIGSKDDALNQDGSDADGGVPGETHRPDKATKTFSKPVWKSDETMTMEEIKSKRDVFWDTQPHYGGSREIWDALKAVCEAEDMETAKLIIESAGIIMGSADMTTYYDERGAKYDLPKYVLSFPTNLAS